MFQQTPCAIVVLLLLNLSVLLSPIASAQQTYKNYASAKKPQTDNEQSLKEPPELPDLPGYTGKFKFIKAFTKQNGQGFTAYRCNYLAKESMQQIIEWYDRALKAYGWKIVDEHPTGIVAYQQKDGLTCAVFVNEAAKSTGYPTQLSVQLGQAPPVSKPGQ